MLSAVSTISLQRSKNSSPTHTQRVHDVELRDGTNGKESQKRRFPQVRFYGLSPEGIFWRYNRRNVVMIAVLRTCSHKRMA